MIALVNSTSGTTDGNSATTSAMDTTGATLIVLVTSKWSSNANTVSDSQGNTWTAMTEQQAGTNATRLRFYYCASPTTNASHTFTTSGTSLTPAIIAFAFSGTATSSPADQSSGSGTDSDVTSRMPGSITPSQNGCVCITGITLNATTAGLAIDGTGWSTPVSIPASGGVNLLTAASYKIQTTAAAEDRTWSWTTPRKPATWIASFLPPAGGSNPTPIIIQRLYR